MDWRVIKNLFYRKLEVLFLKNDWPIGVIPFVASFLVTFFEIFVLSPPMVFLLNFIFDLTIPYDFRSFMLSYAAFNLAIWLNEDVFKITNR
jgi:hypothetical protein